MKYWICWSILVFILIICPDFGEVPFVHSSNRTNAGEPDNSLQRAEHYFDNLKFDSAAFLYQSFLQSRIIMDSLYFSAANRCIEAFWWQCWFPEAEQLARNCLPMAAGTIGPDHPETGKLCLNLGILGFITGSTVMTEEYLQKAKEIITGRYGQNHPLSATVYEWLGAYHESFNDRVNCYAYLNEARSIWLKTRGPDHPDLGNVYRYLGLYHKRYERHDSARFFFRKAMRLFDHRYGPDNLQSVKCLNNECDLYEHAGDYDAALKSYQEALRRVGRATGEIRMVHTMTLLNLADHYKQRNNPLRSLDYIQQVFPIFFPGFSNRTIFDNPVTLKDQHHYYLLLTLSAKSALLKDCCQKDPGHPESYLACALQCDSLIHQINQQMKRQIINLDNLLSFEQSRAAWYYGFSLNALDLYTLTHNKRYISAALSFMESGRNLQLPGKTMLQSGLYSKSPALYHAFDSLHKRINRIKSRLTCSSGGKEEEDDQRLLRDSKIALDALFYEAYILRGTDSCKPEQTDGILLDQVQANLDTETIIFEIFELYLDYLRRPSGFLIFAITNDAFEHYELQPDSLTPWLTEFSSMVSDPSAPLKRMDSAGKVIFGRLLAPAGPLMASKSKIVVIPSPETWMIPFDVLPADSGFGEGHLIDHFTIRKEFSLLSWLAGNQDHRETDIKVLAVAPEFEPMMKKRLVKLAKRDSSLLELPGSKKECEAIGRICDTRILTGNNVTKEEFLALAPSYPVIHLSTHGVSSPENPELPGLAFNAPAGSTGAEAFLSFYDILNMNLNSSLITMSACRSAQGKWSKSEGNISLAWAFRQAGASSFIVSLWDVNDYASSVIMPAFYLYLKEGFSRPEAIRKAKLDYLKASDAHFQHPFFWAGFDYIGNDQGLGGTGNNHFFIVTVLILFVSVFVLIGIYFLVKKI